MLFHVSFCVCSCFNYFHQNRILLPYFHINLMYSNLLSSFLSCSKRDMPEEKKIFFAPVKFFPLSTFLFVFLLAALRKPAGLHNLLLALSQPRSQLAASKTATPRPSVMAAGRGGTTWPPLSVVHTLLSDRRRAQLPTHLDEAVRGPLVSGLQGFPRSWIEFK